MKKIIQISFLISTAIILMISCKSKYDIQGYTLDRNLKFCDSCADKKVWAETNVKKSIILISDSILNYSVIYGHIGSLAKIEYRISNDTLIMGKKSLNGIPLVNLDIDKEFANKFLYSKDSLRNIETRELFYANSGRNKKNKFDQFYVVLSDTIIKLDNRRKAIRVIKKIDPEKKFKLINKDSAKIQYGIAKRFSTFKVSD